MRIHKRNLQNFSFVSSIIIKRMFRRPKAEKLQEPRKTNRVLQAAHNIIGTRLHSITGFFMFFSCPLLFNACFFMEMTAQITVKNESGYAVTNIALIYNHGSGERKTETIAALAPNAEKTVTVSLYDTSMMTYVSPVGIRYALNGKQYGDTDDGPLYSEARIGGAQSHLIFIINNNGYVFENTRR